MACTNIKGIRFRPAYDRNITLMNAYHASLRGLER